MKFDDRLLKIVVCPETRQALVLASDELLKSLNERIAADTISNRRGDRVVEPLEALLVREDQRFGYPVRNSIPELLIDEAIRL